MLKTDRHDRVNDRRVLAAGCDVVAEQGGAPARGRGKRGAH